VKHRASNQNQNGEWETDGRTDDSTIHDHMTCMRQNESEEWLECISECRLHVWHVRNKKH